MLFRLRGPSLLVHAPAKLNLFLDVRGRRTDGFHELETLLVSVGLYDTLSFTDEPDGGVRLDVVDGAVPDGPENLVHRAASLLRERTGTTRGVRIGLRKRIPAAAGLGGGSSDAAATLAGLNRLWDLGLSAAELQELALPLGSDVGFFLASSPVAVGRGRGDVLEPLTMPLGLHFVVVHPRTGLSTPAVYEAYANAPRAAETRSVAPLVDAWKRGRLPRLGRLLHNALQGAAESLNTDVTQLGTTFKEQPVVGHLMSGSGSAYFGLCTTRRQALSIASRLRAMRAGRVFAVDCRP